MPRVRGVIFASIAAGSIFIVPGQTSTRTGVAPQYLHRIRGGDIGHCRDDDFIARLQAQADQRKVQRGGAVIGCDGMPDPAEPRKCFFELADVLAVGRNPAGVEAVHYILAFVSIELGLRYRDAVHKELRIQIDALLLRLRNDFGGNANNCRGCGNIVDHHAARPCQCISPDPHAGNHLTAYSQKSAIFDDDRSCQSALRGQMHGLANNAVMIDCRPGVDDCKVADHGLGVDDSASHDGNAASQFCRW